MRFLHAYVPMENRKGWGMFNPIKCEEEEEEESLPGEAPFFPF